MFLPLIPPKPPYRIILARFCTATGRMSEDENDLSPVSKAR